MTDEAGDFRDDQIEEILKRTSDGEPLTRICRDPRMLSRATIYNMVNGNEEFAGRFRAARARGVHALAEECLEIADEPVTSEDSVAVANKRVRIDTRLRLAGKWLPGEYGDKLEFGGKIDGRTTLAFDEKSLPPALAFLARFGAQSKAGPDTPSGSVV